MLESILKEILREGLFRGVYTWDGNFDRISGATRCRAILLHGRQDTMLQLGTTDSLSYSVVVPAWQYEEDGELINEPEYVKIESFDFLQLESLTSRDHRYAARHEIFEGLLDSVEVYHAVYQLNSKNGSHTRTALAGLKFDFLEGDSLGYETSFSIIQKSPRTTLEIGPSSLLMSDLPANLTASVVLSLAGASDQQRCEQAAPSNR